ncbi:MAG TPA: hypothetical protein VK633_07405, partial [Verrucomicrobiae bacterium]|nr:hypothetical protein [Verrucomicrobiae bacterium]
MKKFYAVIVVSISLCAVLPAEIPLAGGLIFELDASKQKEAREAASLPPVGNRQPFDFFLNTAPGAVGIASQPIPERRPLFVSDETAAYFQFDGQDDFLTSAMQIKPAAELTVFVLAAPKSNSGPFTGIFATAAPGRNDYTSGLNLDLGPLATKELSVLNVESAGATGFRDLLVPGFFNAAERPFGDFHVFTVRTRVGKTGTETFLDGFKGGERG